MLYNFYAFVASTSFMNLLISHCAAQFLFTLGDVAGIFRTVPVQAGRASPLTTTASYPLANLQGNR